MHKKEHQKQKVSASATWRRPNGNAPHKIGRRLTKPTIPPHTSLARPPLSTGSRAAEIARKYERMKAKEQWLREEIRDNRKMMLGLLKWGVAVLTGIESSLYFIRRDVSSHLAQMGMLPPDGIIPPTRWFVGTIFLTMIALIFTTLTRYMSGRHVAYRRQLIEMPVSFSGIVERPTGGNVNHLPIYLYLAFPLFDFVLYFYFLATAHYTITW